jgi:hypothetical protein
MSRYLNNVLTNNLYFNGTGSIFYLYNNNGYLYFFGPSGSYQISNGITGPTGPTGSGSIGSTGPTGNITTVETLISNTGLNPNITTSFINATNLSLSLTGSSSNGFVKNITSLNGTGTIVSGNYIYNTATASSLIFSNPSSSAQMIWSSSLNQWVVTNKLGVL